MKNIAIILTDKKDMQKVSEIATLKGYNTSKIQYPAIATLQNISGRMVVMGTHPLSERNFLEDAGYLILSIDN